MSCAGSISYDKLIAVKNNIWFALKSTGRPTKVCALITAVRIKTPAFPVNLNVAKLKGGALLITHYNPPRGGGTCSHRRYRTI